MNSRDMCMIDHLDDLMDAGLSSLKIEGRAKSAYYAAIVTGAYRHCLDDAAAGRAHRPCLAGRGGARQPPPLLHRLLLRPAGPVLRKFPLYPGVAGGGTGDGRATRRATPSLSLRNKFRTGDTVELVGPDLRPFAMTVPEMRDENGRCHGRTPEPADALPNSSCPARCRL